MVNYMAHDVSKMNLAVVIFEVNMVSSNAKRVSGELTSEQFLKSRIKKWWF